MCSIPSTGTVVGYNREDFQQLHIAVNVRVNTKSLRSTVDILVISLLPHPIIPSPFLTFIIPILSRPYSNLIPIFHFHSSLFLSLPEHPPGKRIFSSPSCFHPQNSKLPIDNRRHTSDNKHPRLTTFWFSPTTKRSFIFAIFRSFH